MLQASQMKRYLCSYLFNLLFCLKKKLHTSFVAKIFGASDMHGTLVYTPYENNAIFLPIS